MIVLYEPPMENWGVRGGKPSSEVDFGFKINIGKFRIIFLNSNFNFFNPF